MARWVRTVAREKGVALPLALFALVMLSGLLVAFLSMAGMEPQIAANLNDVTRARYVAEAGIEWGYDCLVINWANRNTLLTTNGGTMGPPDCTLPVGLLAADGTFTVTVRNDDLGGDATLTGQPPCNPQGASDCAGPGNDTNSVVILTATGTFRGTTRQIRVVMTHLDININESLDLPGVGSNTKFSGNSFIISGNDTNLNGGAGAGAAGCPSSVYGIGVADAATETLVQSSLSQQQKDNVIGKKMTNPGPPPVYDNTGQGDNTIEQDASLTPAQIQKFVNKIKPYADISLTSSGSNHLKYQNLGDTCATNMSGPNCWGTIADPATGVAGNPKIVYLKGDVDPAQAFYALEISGTSAGAGILIIEDGDLKITGNFRWEGLIIITGAYTGLYYGGGGDQTIYGGIVVNETVNVNSEVEVDAAGNAKLLYSCQAINNVKNSRKWYQSQSWREL